MRCLYSLRGYVLIKQVLPNLYSIHVPLPDSPLKSLNSYVFKGRERSLLVDTGFNLPECLAALQDGIAELELDMHRTDILVTHGHADHCGQVTKIATESTKVYMSAQDHKMTSAFIENPDANWQRVETYYIGEGFPAEEMQKSRMRNPARAYVSDKTFSISPIVDQQLLPAGDSELLCLTTPGHTPGHMCFYGAKEKLLIAGDHVLFDITPNITVWADMLNALERYMDSLRKVIVI